MEMVFDHPQTEARDMVSEIDLPGAKSGKIKILGISTLFITPARGTDSSVSRACNQV